MASWTTRGGALTGAVALLCGRGLHRGIFGGDRLLEIIQAPSGDVSLWMNGTANGVASFPLPEDKPRNQNFLGRTLYVNCPTWHGEISELIVYARALDMSERLELETYLTDKWECCGT